MQQNLSTLFYLKRAKKMKSGQMPIYLRITVDGHRSEFSINRSIIPELWNVKGGMPKGTKEDAKSLTSFITKIRSDVFNQFNIMQSKELCVTSDLLKKAIKGESDDKHTIITVFLHHNEQIKARIGKDYAEGTHMRYKVTLDKVTAYIKYQYHRSDLFLDELDHKFITDFEYYLASHDNLSHNSMVRYIKHLKKIIKISMSNRWILSDPFINYKCTLWETNRGFLSAEELSTLTEKQFSIKRLELVRDMFLFCCYTGLAFADAEKLTKDNINIGIDGDTWLIVFRHKTDTRTSS